VGKYTVDGLNLEGLGGGDTRQWRQETGRKSLAFYGGTNSCVEEVTPHCGGKMKDSIR